MKWSGINQAIDRLAAENQGKVPKDKLLQFLETEGKVEFEEVRYGGNRPNLESEAEFAARRSDAGSLSREERDRLVEMRRRYQRSAGDALDANNFDLANEFLREAKSIGELLDPQPKVRPARFEQYSLPGGENYREVALSMPEVVEKYTLSNTRVLSEAEAAERALRSDSIKRFWFIKTPDQLFQISKEKYPSAGQAVSYVINEKLPGRMGGENYRSSHFRDVPNYIAHMRLTDRPDAQGRPGLFIEEVQSDRHQAGKKRGYKTGRDFDKELEEVNKKADPYLAEMRDAPRELLEQAASIQDARLAEESLIPDAPFRKDWPVQMFRRALKEAVMDGKEWVGWTTGETQAARYDLSKQIDSIKSYKNPDGLYSLQLIKDGVVIDAKSQLKEAGLSEMVGKELADKIVSGKGKNIETETSRKLNRQDREFSGLDLKVGGEGMKAFYDKILPNEVAKYVKQWGGTVEKARIGQPKKHSGKLTKEELSEARRDAKALVRGDIDTDEFNATWNTKLDSDDIPGRDPYRFNESVQEIVNLVRKTRELDAGGLYDAWKVRVTPEMVEGLKQLDEIEMEISSKSRAIRRQLEPAQ